MNRPSATKTVWLRTLSKGALLVIVGMSALLLFELAAHHLNAGNSDGATVVLEGQALATGNLSLAGWTLSFDSFWTIDAPVYALAEGIFGVRPLLLTIVPSLLAALVLLLSLHLAAR